MVQPFHPPARKLMGYGCNQQNVLLCLNALGQVMNQHGVPVDTKLSLEAAQAVY
jgi:alanine-glyoxylate transaminase/serine-glyoxylate transaminase/serine-pyruvate transaminase